MKKSNIFIIYGPSGSGQDSIIEGLGGIIPIERVITTTSRSMRPCESSGKPYYFITMKDFKKRIDAGEFIEYAEQYNGNLYGVTKEEVERVGNSGKTVSWKVDFQGATTIKKLFPETKSIFITVSDLKILENRIRRRDNEGEEYIQERMKYTKEWIDRTGAYDYKIFNEEGKLDEAIKKVAEIIKQHT
jgi:guanylate kinase